MRMYSLDVHGFAVILFLMMNVRLIHPQTLALACECGVLTAAAVMAPPRYSPLPRHACLVRQNPNSQAIITNLPILAGSGCSPMAVARGSSGCPWLISSTTSSLSSSARYIPPAACRGICGHLNHETINCLPPRPTPARRSQTLRHLFARMGCCLKVRDDWAEVRLTASFPTTATGSFPAFDVELLAPTRLEVRMSI